MYFLVTVVVIAWIIAWLVGAFGVVRRGDLGIAAKILWIIMLLIVPFLGLLIWYIWQAANPDRSGREVF